MTMTAHDIEIGSPLALGSLSLTIDHDPMPECPWRAWDGCAPLLANTSDGLTPYGEDLRDVFDDLPDHWFSRHWRALCGILDLCPNDHDRDAREQARDYGEPLSWIRREAFSDVLRNDLTKSQTIDALADLWQLRGRPAIVKSVNGYCQGDWARVLVVATEAHCEAVGHKIGPDSDIYLNSEASLWGAWAFGDVFEYTIKDSDGETLDSCSGFYGCPWGNNPGKGWDVLNEALSAASIELRATLATQFSDWREACRDDAESVAAMDGLASAPAFASEFQPERKNQARLNIRETIAAIRHCESFAEPAY